MFLAKTLDGRRISATREEDGQCPKCNALLTPRMGDINEWHWSHKPGQTCDYRKSATFWHYAWMKRYHAMADWDLETTVGGFEFDGINSEKKLALLLTKKLLKSEIDEFVAACMPLGLKPLVIINSAAFKNFNFVNGRLKPKLSHNPAWKIFWDHAHQGATDRSASIWLDIDSGVFPDFGLQTGAYNLSYANRYYGEIAVNPKPRTKS